jgi:hypothetical protein
MRRLTVSIAVTIAALCSSSFGIDYATQYNNGPKLMLKEGTDSLFRTYNYYGLVMHAYSEGGISWYADLVAAGHDCPAIAADSTGKRWIVARKPQTLLNYDQQDLYYFSGGSWQSVTLYTAGSQTKTLGPASLAGASSTTTGIVYAAFGLTNNSTGAGNIILTKFNGTTVDACTLANFQYGVGDPAVAIEPYTADSNRIHVVWEDPTDENIRYARGVDGRSSEITPYILTTDTGISGGGKSRHAGIGADRERIVVAWEKRVAQDPDIYDVYAREQSAGVWQAMQNLSNNANYSSEYPTVAIGDTVVVAWDEAISAGDHDIYACINFDPNDIENIADDDTFSFFPHVALQDAGDELYLHTIWSEPDYVVGYDKLDLRDDGGEGQLSAGSAQITPKPLLAVCEPNPFRGHTLVSYALPAAANVSLGVYDVTGRTVRTLASGHQKAGSYSVTWDSKDNRGRQAPRGVYFYRLDTPGFRSVKKAIVTR